MTKEQLKIRVTVLVTTVIKTLAHTHNVSDAAIEKALTEGNLKLTNQFTDLLEQLKKDETFNEKLFCN